MRTPRLLFVKIQREGETERERQRERHRETERETKLTASAATFRALDPLQEIQRDLTEK